MATTNLSGSGITLGSGTSGGGITIAPNVNDSSSGIVNASGGSTLGSGDFSSIEAKLNGLIANTIEILDGFSSLDTENIKARLEEIREEALKVAGNPVSVENVEKVKEEIAKALEDAINRISAAGGVDVSAFTAQLDTKLQEATQTLEGLKAQITQDSQSLKAELTTQAQEIKKELDEKLANAGGEAFKYVETENPTENVNPSANAFWYNKISGEMFYCQDFTPDKNVWIGNNGSKIGGVFGLFNQYAPVNTYRNDKNLSFVWKATGGSLFVFSAELDTWVKCNKIAVSEDMPLENTDLKNQDLVLNKLDSKLYLTHSLNDTLKNTYEEITTLDYILDSEPVQNTNPDSCFELAFALDSGKFYICFDNTPDKNVWEEALNINAYSTSSVHIKLNNTLEIGAGEEGFGGGIPSDKILLELGLEKLSGSTDRTSAEWSNYVHTKSGSVMYYTPLMYRKLTPAFGEPYYGVKVEFSYTKKDGFVTPRCFYNAGKLHQGLFLDRYLNSLGKEEKNKNMAVSVRGALALGTAKPVSSYVHHYYINKYGEDGFEGVDKCIANGQTPTLSLEGCFDAAKSRGEKFFWTPFYVRTHFNYLMLAKFQQCALDGTLSQRIAWSDVSPFAPRGCGVQWLKDLNDKSVVFEGIPTKNTNGTDGKAYIGKTGGAQDAYFAKSTIFGDLSSPSDWEGPYTEFFCGVNGDGVNKTAFLKKTSDISTLNAGSHYQKFNFDFNATLPFISTPSDSTYKSYLYYGDGNAQTFNCASEEDTAGYVLDELMIPKAKYTSSNELFGGDYVVAVATQKGVAGSGGNYASIGYAGYGAFSGFFPRGVSYGASYSGFRACLMGEAF